MADSQSPTPHQPKHYHKDRIQQEKEEELKEQLSTPQHVRKTSTEELLNFQMTRKKMLLEMDKMEIVEDVVVKDEPTVIRGFEFPSKQIGKLYVTDYYLSRDTRDDKDVLIKMIALNRIKRQLLKHFETNTNKILWFIHKTNFLNTVCIYDWFRLNDKTLIIVEEFLNYSLENIINTVHNLMKEKEIRRYAEGLAAAVNFLHNAGIAHQNISGRSVFISPYNKIVKLSCMEYAIIYWDPIKDELKPQHLLVDMQPGRFVAPEVIHTYVYDPTKADVYSFGTVIYLMAIGRYPYQCGEFQLPQEQQWSTSKSEFAAKMSEEARDLVDKCTQRVPDERPKMRHIVEHPWFTEKL